MVEPIRANLTVLNQLAKKHLRKIKWGPDPHELYALQLAQWALIEDLFILHWRADNLPAYVDKFLRLDQNWANGFLEGSLDGEGPQNILYGVDPKISTVELAQLILQQLHDRLVAEVEFYP